MKATLERAPGSRVVLEIEVPPDEMSPEIEQAFRRLSRQVRIPGFRPGKAPAPMIERAIGRPRLLQEALNPMVARAYREALGEQGLRALEQPSIEVKEFADGEGLHFVATVAVVPEVRLGDYAAVREVVAPRPIGEADVERALEDLRDGRATWVPTDDAAADGHLVLLSTLGQVTGGPRIDESRVEGVLGVGRLRPEIEEAVRGVLAGGSVEVDLTFPADDASEALRGRSAHLRVDLLEVKRKELPALDEAFAAEASEHQTLEELRADLGNRLRQAARAEALQVAVDAVAQRVVEASEVELPDVLVGQTMDNLMAELGSELARSGVTLSVYLQQRGQTEEGLREGLRPRAERTVRTRLVLGALARDAGILPTDGEVDAEIARQAAASGADAARFRQAASRPETRAVIAEELARRFAVRWLADNAVVEGEDGAPADGAPPAPAGGEPAAAGAGDAPAAEGGGPAAPA